MSAKPETGTAKGRGKRQPARNIRSRATGLTKAMRQLQSGKPAGIARIHSFLVENSNDIAYVADDKATLLYVSPQARRYGMEPDKLVSGSIASIIHPDDAERVIADFQRSISTGEEFPTVFRIADNSGRYRWFEDRGRMIRDGSGRIVGVAGIVRDVTETRQTHEMKTLESKRQLRKQARQLEEKNAALREILAHLETEKENIRRNVAADIDTLVMPLVERLKPKAGRHSLKSAQLLESRLRQITSRLGFATTMDTARLSPRESEICGLVEKGMDTGEIAGLLALSRRTVETHRNRIRRKLGINREQVNLATHLRTLKPS